MQVDSEAQEDSGRSEQDIQDLRKNSWENRSFRPKDSQATNWLKKTRSKTTIVISKSSKSISKRKTLKQRVLDSSQFRVFLERWELFVLFWVLLVVLRRIQFPKSWPETNGQRWEAVLGQVCWAEGTISGQESSASRIKQETAKVAIKIIQPKRAFAVSGQARSILEWWI